MLRLESEVEGDGTEEEGSAQYLTANCLLVTYFNGDSANLVDEHFDRALNNEKMLSSDKHQGSCGEKCNSSRCWQ